MKEELSSAFLLLMDHNILERIGTCIELEESAMKSKEWMLPKLYFATLYAHGAYEGNTFNIYKITDENHFFSQLLV